MAGRKGRTGGIGEARGGREPAGGRGVERNGVGKADGAAERGQEAAALPERVPSPRQLSPCSGGGGRLGGLRGPPALPFPFPGRGKRGSEGGSSSLSLRFPGGMKAEIGRGALRLCLDFPGVLTHVNCSPISRS